VSWPFFRAAAGLHLPAPQKLIALALGDLCGADGSLEVSNGRLRHWTGQSEQTVRRALRDVMREQLAKQTRPGDRLTHRPAAYQLYYPGANLEGGSFHRGRRSPANVAADLVPQWHPLPKNVSQEQPSALPRAARPVIESIALELLKHEGYADVAGWRVAIESQLRTDGMSWDPAELGRIVDALDNRVRIANSMRRRARR
jgi:hypothetical protein